MALFDVLIGDLATRLGLGAAAAPLAKEALTLVVGGNGGIAGFLDLFKRAGLGAVASSWLGEANPAPLAVGDLQEALGAPAIDGIAHRVGVALPAATAALGYALPKLVGLLTPHGVVPSATPAEAAAFLAPVAVPAQSGDVHGRAAVVKPIPTSSVAPVQTRPGSPVWLWPATAVAVVAGLAWAVWPILFPNHPPQATSQTATPAIAEAPAPVAAPSAADAAKPAPAPAAAATPTVAEAVKAAPASPAPARYGAIADALASAEASANAKAATALGSLKAGFSGDDLVAVLNQAAFSFPYGKADLPSSVQDLLAQVAASVKKLPPGAVLEIAGYTDNVGDPKANVALSQHRAEAVRDALVTGGASSNALVAKGYGGADPIFHNDADEGRYRNHRIEFHALKAPVAMAASGGTSSTGEWATTANAKAAAALGALKDGYGATDVVSALNLSVVNFGTASAEVPDPVASLLRHAAGILKALPPGYTIEIAGYTDNTGDADGNLALSRQRASSVRDVLVKAGAPEDMLTAKGYGSANPLDSNDTEEGRLRNRRIEYHVTRTP